MLIYDYAAHTKTEVFSAKDFSHNGEDLLIIAYPQEMAIVQSVYAFPISTVRDCVDLDEAVRYNSFDGFDFLSLVRMDRRGSDISLREYNVYVSGSYLVLVIPEDENMESANLREEILRDARLDTDGAKNRLDLYYMLLHTIIGSYSADMEELEDEMESLLEEVTSSEVQKDYADIYQKKKAAYTAKKLLRALSYTTSQILEDANGVLDEPHMKMFANIDTRFQKMYGYAQDVYELSTELLTTYDSRVTMKTNDTINKLTVLTIFFSPLTVITGIYGMNFRNMPELDWRYGYLYSILLMAAISIILYFVLKKKKWM